MTIVLNGQQLVIQGAIFSWVWLIFGVTVHADFNLILNGDFENTSATTDVIDPPNAVFNFRMEDVNAYGMREGIDIHENGSTVNSQNGNWSIAMKADAGGDSEEIAFSLVNRLDHMDEYRLEFYIKALIDIPHVGGTVQIGLASNPLEFGSIVFESSPTGSLDWEKIETRFFAPYNARYLTVRVDDSANHWVALDNFKLTHVQGDLLLNGSFEDNLIENFDEAFELPNEDFNLLMNNVTAFGSTNGLDILVDLIGQFPIDGNWKVTGGGPEVATGDAEAFSMTLVEPVKAFQPYYVEFYQERAIIAGAPDSGFVRIGVSNMPTSFGLQVYESPEVTTTWKRVGTVFTAPIFASYLTVEINSGDDEWVAVDGFSLRPFQIGDVNFDGETNLLDVTPFVEVITVGHYLAEADTNFDGKVDLLDVQEFVKLLTSF